MRKRLPTLDMREKRRVTFMIIGAQKAGTTWLHANLCDHPQVTLPPLKELFYFNEIDSGIPTDFRGRIKNNHWLNIKWKRVIMQPLPQAFFKGKFAKAWWYLRYLTAPRNLKTSSLMRYDRLFPKKAGTISGDITPNYSILSADTVKAIAGFYPDCKILFFLRNPIERSWSQAKMTLGKLRDQNIHEVPLQEMEAYISHDVSNEQHSDYKATIDRWSSYFPKDQLCFDFYDALKEDPVAFYRRVLTFLEIDDVYDVEKLSKVVYKGADLEMPLHFEHLLYSKFYEQLRFLAAYFKDYPCNYPQRWLERAEQVLHNRQDNDR